MACVVVPTGVMKLQPYIADIPGALFLELWVSKWGWEGAWGGGVWERRNGMPRLNSQN